MLQVFRGIREKRVFYKMKRGNTDKASACSIFSIKERFLEVDI